MATKGPNDASLSFIPTQPNGTVLNTPTSYWRGHGFKPQSGDRPIWRAVIVVFFSTLGTFTIACFRIVSFKRKLKEVITRNKQKELIPHLNTTSARFSQLSASFMWATYRTNRNLRAFLPRDFRRSRRIAKSDCSLRHICPSAWNNSAPTELIFMKFGSIFRKSAEKIKVSLKSDENNWYITWRPIYIYANISLNSFRMRNVSDKSCRENQDTRFMFNKCFPKKGIV
jgi:hypothetical protein